jgi:hypothetical protein
MAAETLFGVVSLIAGVVSVIPAVFTYLTRTKEDQYLNKQVREIEEKLEKLKLLTSKDDPASEQTRKILVEQLHREIETMNPEVRDKGTSKPLHS